MHSETALRNVTSHRNENSMTIPLPPLKRLGQEQLAGIRANGESRTSRVPRFCAVRGMTRLLVLVTCAATWSPVLLGCPFCPAVSQTFSEEMMAMDVVLFARLTEMANDDEEDAWGELPKCKFEITKIFNGEAWYAVGDTIEVHYFGASSDGVFLIMGTDPPQTMWGTPLIVSERVQHYLKTIPELPAGPERLEYFMDFLEDEDELLARDAYDEFAKTPYEGIIALKDSMDHDQLVDWISDPNIPASRKRLYLTMLGVCGSKDDCKMLESMMRSDDGERKTGLDAMIGCYLSLAGEDGLPLIEELFLDNTEAEYTDTYAAIMAYRFHGNDHDLIPRKKLLPGLRAVLNRPDLADLVIPDLARWEDWEVMPQLIELFENANDDSNWVRVPVINYLAACPKESAAAAIEELKKIDPEAVSRAQTYFPFTQFAGKKRNDETTTSDPTADAPREKADESLAARQSVVPKMKPRDRTIRPTPTLPETKGFNWIPTAIFGGLLVVALVLRKLTSGQPTNESPHAKTGT